MIPGEVRDKLGIKKGDNLALGIKDNEIMLTMCETKEMENDAVLEIILTILTTFRSIYNYVFKQDYII